MCDKCPEDSYGSAYRSSPSVTVKLKTYCPRCHGPIEMSSQIHFGGEFWSPYFKCSSCGLGEIVNVYISDVNDVRKEKVTG